jgi:hypothetical protein
MRGQNGSIIKGSAQAEMVLMQTKGGGKHVILHVGRATATMLDCLWMMPRDPDADVCPGTETVLVIAEECLSHQSCVPCADSKATDPTLAQCIARSRRFVYDQTMEEFIARSIGTSAGLGGKIKANKFAARLTARKCCLHVGLRQGVTRPSLFDARCATPKSASVSTP